ncbi:E3 ubiquitin-protein ligase cblA-like isoform X1 [Culicoides brevitarsis]|uniref:E3 ubiquitin-protein ligase cblA-like isoform X1 n=1 Tax=Culicoides brevitarsis TaxID=469753 RepID=UPI00307C8F1E
MSNNRTNNNRNNEQEQSGGNWLLAAGIGVAVGAGLAYMFGKSSQESQQRCSENRNSSSCGTNNFEAAPRGCCSICRDEYDATITLRCGHILHRDCYEQMKLHTRGELLCPLCRKRAE